MKPLQDGAAATLPPSPALPVHPGIHPVPGVGGPTSIFIGSDPLHDAARMQPGAICHEDGTVELRGTA
jgi:hypothetical protein